MEAIKWEYFTDSTSILTDNYLNSFGEDGWELVSVVMSINRHGYHVVFKRRSDWQDLVIDRALLGK